MIGGSGVIAFARDLVRIPSVLGSEGSMADRVIAEMRALDFDWAEIDEAGNAVGVLGNDGDGATLVLDAHMDTVDALESDAWARDPFGAELSQGKIWGRGASDMKGALAAIIHGVAAADRDGLRGRVVVVGSVEEERIEGAALELVCDRYEPDWVVIGEATDLQLARGGRGRVELVCETKGRPAHASTPDRGVHAVHRMIRVIEQIEALPQPRHPLVGRGVMCLTDLISEPYPAHSVVPTRCRATYEKRLVPGEEKDGVLAEVRAACARVAPDTEIRLARAEVETYSGFVLDREKWLPAWELEPESPLVVQALEALRSTGIEPELGAYQFCTNAAYTAGIADLPTIGFGPGREELAHIIDEYLEVDQLLAAYRGYRAITEALLS